MEDDDDEEVVVVEVEVWPCGGVALRPGLPGLPAVAAGGSAFSGLRESSEMPPLPLPLRAGGGGGAAATVAVGLCAPGWLCCSEDLGEGVAVDTAEMGEEAAELPAPWGVEGGRAAGCTLLTLLWASAPSGGGGASPSRESRAPASRAESRGLSALKLGFSPSATAACT